MAAGFYAVQWKFNGSSQAQFCGFGGVDNKEAIYRAPSTMQISPGNVPVSISEDNVKWILLKPRGGTGILPDTQNQYLDKGISTWWLKTDDGRYFTINLNRATKKVDLLVSP